MVTQIPTTQTETILYPDSDGQPMADNTKQFELIVWLKENFELLFADHPNVFVAGDLLWYAVERKPAIRRAPDVMVIFGRPKGYRGSYRQWQEDNIPPQVVFEIVSPGNTLKELAQKFAFYHRYGVEEYYLYDPDKNELCGWLKNESEFEVIEQINEWVSPRLQVRFEVTGEGWMIYRPDGQPFLTYLELDRRWQEAEIRAEEERQRAEQERQRADNAEQQLEALLARMRAMGIEPND